MKNLRTCKPWEYCTYVRVNHGNTTVRVNHENTYGIVNQKNTLGILYEAKQCALSAVLPESKFNSQLTKSSENTTRNRCDHPRQRIRSLVGCFVS